MPGRIRLAGHYGEGFHATGEEPLGDLESYVIVDPGNE
jgi:hypothetical protein